jgi:hypothetical protein
MPVAMTAHAYERIKERIAFKQPVSIDAWAKDLLRSIQRGEAELVRPTKGCDRFVYDVQTNTPAYTGTVRLVVDSTKSFVISVVPPIDKFEVTKRWKKEKAEAKGQRKREFHRSLRMENDDADTESHHDAEEHI